MLSLASCYSSADELNPDDPADTQRVARLCAEGQMSTAGWLPWPESTLSVVEPAYLIPVIARRATERATLMPSLWESGGGAHIASCQEGATHEIVDGLGWIDEGDVDVIASLGSYYTALADGRRHPDIDLWMESFFDPEWDSLAPDDELYLLVLNVYEPASMWLDRRVALTRDASGALMVSGEYTLSGEDTPVEAFRAP